MSSGSDFIVESILNKRVKNNQIEYLIKWEGYSIEEATWEPVRNLSNIKDMIRRYERYERYEIMKEGSIKNNMCKSYMLIILICILFVFVFVFFVLYG